MRRAAQRRMRSARRTTTSSMRTSRKSSATLERGEVARCAAVSVPADIAEGHARSGTPELLHFPSIAAESLSGLDTLIETRTATWLSGRHKGVTEGSGRRERDGDGSSGVAAPAFDRLKHLNPSLSPFPLPPSLHQWPNGTTTMFSAFRRTRATTS
ncbi:MAG: four helix bundle protein [Limnobacter sp.]|nr:four helix bundle protein [Limnobacter sp.]